MNPAQTEVRDNTNLVYDPIGTCPFPVRGVDYRTRTTQKTQSPIPSRKRKKKQMSRRNSRSSEAWT